MAFDGSLKFDTQIDTKGFATGTNTIKAQANGLMRTIATLGKVLGAAFAISIGKKAVNFASDLTEVQNVVDTAFGDMAYKMEAFAKTSIETFGISKLAAKQMGSTYMAMATGMGEASAAASDMAINITGRLADIMSFYNKSANEVDTIGKAIYTGETEPLKAIGVVMTEANLSAYALSKGMAKAYTEMSSGEKLLVRQQFFLEQTSLAAGDFAKTSDSWANQTRVLSEKWKEFLGILGTGIIQVLTPVVKYISTALTYLTEFASTVGNILSDVFGFEKQVTNSAAATSELNTSSGDASAGVNELGDSVEKTSKQIGKSLSPIDQLNNMTSDLAENTAGGIQIDTSVKTGADNANIDTSKSDKISKLSGIIKTFAENLKKLWDAVAPLAVEIGKGFIDFIQNIASIGAGAFNGWIPGGINAIAGALNKIDAENAQKVGAGLAEIGLFFAGFKIVKGLVDFLSGVGGALATIGSGLTIFTTLNPVGFVVIFNDLFDGIQNSIWDMLPDWAKDLWTGFWDVVTNIFKSTFNFDQTFAIWEQVVKAFKDAFDGGTWYEIGWNIIKGIFLGIAGILSFPIEVVVDFFNTLIKNIKSVFGIASPAKKMEPYGKYILLGLLEGFKGAFSDWWTAIATWGTETLLKFSVWAGKIWGSVKTVFTGVGGWFKGRFEAAWNNIKTVFEPFTSFFSGLWEGITSGFSKALWSLKDLAKAPINGVIGILNTLIDAMNKLNFDIPNWVPGAMGGKSFGFNMTKIPYLATGTVIPPNSQFMAMLGDQKKGVNIEAPLDTIVEAFKLANSQNGRGNGEIHIHFDGDAKGLFKLIKKAEKDNYSMTGDSIFVH